MAGPTCRVRLRVAVHAKEEQPDRGNSSTVQIKKVSDATFPDIFDFHQLFRISCTRSCVVLHAQQQGFNQCSQFVFQHAVLTLVFQEFFSGKGPSSGVPEVEGHLHIKGDGKSWSRKYCVLRQSGLYVSKSGEPKKGKKVGPPRLFCC